MENENNGTCLWREKDGIIRLSVTSDSTIGQEWIDRLEGCGYKVRENIRRMLLSPDFKPTSGVKYEAAIIRANVPFPEDDINLTVKNIRAEAERLSMEKLNAEAFCLLSDEFSKREFMHLFHIIVLHEPIGNDYGNPNYLDIQRSIYEAFQSLSSYQDFPRQVWSRGIARTLGHGFAFLVQQE